MFQTAVKPTVHSEMSNYDLKSVQRKASVNFISEVPVKYFTPSELYCHKYSLTRPNIRKQLFQPVSWPPAYKSCTSACRLFSPMLVKNGSQELSESQRGAVRGCLLCNKLL